MMLQQLLAILTATQHRKILPTHLKSVTAAADRVMTSLTSSSSNTAGVQEQQVTMRVAAKRLGVRVGGGNAGEHFRKMTLEWIKNWVEDLVESRLEREMFWAEWEELRP
jgi:hypothetical protein